MGLQPLAKCTGSGGRLFTQLAQRLEKCVLQAMSPKCRKNATKVVDGVLRWHCSYVLEHFMPWYIARDSR